MIHLSLDKILLNITHVFRKGEFVRILLQVEKKKTFILPSTHVSEQINFSLTKYIKILTSGRHMVEEVCLLLIKFLCH